MFKRWLVKKVLRWLGLQYVEATSQSAWARSREAMDKAQQALDMPSKLQGEMRILMTRVRTLEAAHGGLSGTRKAAQ